MNAKLKRDLLIFTIIFGVLTLPFLFFNLDVVLQKPYYSSENGWFLMQIPFWDFLYKYSIFAGYFVAVIALFVISASYWKRNLIKWRKAAYFMLLVIVLGPGVLVNATFKDHWGRPRPREIVEFDGKEEFVKPWVKTDGKGKSFPCGHASIAFYLAIPFLFLRKSYKKWAWFFMIFGTLYGLLVGYARMIAGGHFASDVLWASGMVWFVAILSYYWLKPDKEVDLSAIDEEAQKRKGKLVAVLMGIVLPIMTVGLLLATPYISTRIFDKARTDLDDINMKHFQINIDDGVVNVGFCDSLFIENSVSAFGFPNSKIGWNWIEGDTTTFEYIYMGWFTEVRNEITMKFPTQTSWSNELFVGEGNVYLTLPTDTILKNLVIEIIKGNLNVIAVEDANVNVVSNNSELAKIHSPNASLKLDVRIHEGSIVIED